MLKVFQTEVESFQNFKCGEIFCIAAAAFNVSCCICDTKMLLEQFSHHFQQQHLTLVEESIDLEVLQKKHTAPLSSDCQVLESLDVQTQILDSESIKEEQPDASSLKLLDCVGKVEAVVADGDEMEFDDDKCLQDLINDARTKHRAKIKKSTADGENLCISLRKPRSLSKARETDIVLPAEGPVGKSKIMEYKTAQGKRSTRNAKKPPRFATEEDCVEAIATHGQDEVIKPVEMLSIYKIEPCDSAKEEELNEISDMPWSGGETDSENESDTVGKSSDELPYPCLICKRTYSSNDSLRRHNYTFHNPNKPPNKTRNKAKTYQYKCGECNAVFRTAQELKCHSYKHTGIFCDVCGKQFSQIGNMRTHKIRHTGIRNFKCEDCAKEFFTAKELKQHSICHTGKMPIICEICGRGFRDRAVLKGHMRRHTGERPAKCGVCGKCFFSGHDLNVHAVTHTTERPFKCDICGSTFQRKKALRIHKLIHSNSRKHVCKVCGKGFAQSSGLNSHMRTHDAAIEKTNTKKTEVTEGKLINTLVQGIP